MFSFPVFIDISYDKYYLLIILKLSIRQFNLCYLFHLNFIISDLTVICNLIF